MNFLGLTEKLFQFFLLICIIFFLFSCEEKTLQISDCRVDGSGLLFANTCILLVETQEDVFSNFPVFRINESNKGPINIGIFKSEPLISEGILTNPEDLIWKWSKSRSQANDLISFEEGVIMDSNYHRDQFNCLEEQVLYWAAWAFNENAREVERSTPVFPFTFTPERSIIVSVQQISIIDNNDLFISAGESIKLKITLENKGTQTASNLRGELTNIALPSLPKTEIFNSLEPGESKDLIFNLDLPKDLSFGDSLLFELKLNHSKCIEEPLINFSYQVDGTSIGLTRVSLIQINSTPDPWSYWDPAYIFPYSQPDPYFYIVVNGLDTIFRSEEFENVDPTVPNITWSVLGPSLPLELQNDYAIVFYDDDSIFGFPGDDDLIGDIILSPVDLLKDRNSKETIRSNSLVVELELDWN